MSTENLVFEMPKLDVYDINMNEAITASYLCCTDGVDKNGSSCCEVA